MEEKRLELIEVLGLSDPITIVYINPGRDIFKHGIAHYKVVTSIDWTEEEIEEVLSFIQAVDRLNIKFLRDYDTSQLDEETAEGMLISYERALGTIVYGFLEYLYALFGTKPRVYQAIFGPHLGRVLFDQSLQLKPNFDRLAQIRADSQDSPDAFRDMLSDELNLINQQQKHLAVSLGLSEEVADSAARFLYPYHFYDDTIDFSMLDNAINASGSETVQRRIEEGRDRFPSNEYFLADRLSDVIDGEKRRKLIEAMQEAKDKDRANAGRQLEQSDRGRKSMLNDSDFADE